MTKLAKTAVSATDAGATNTGTISFALDAATSADNPVQSADDLVQRFEGAFANEGTRLHYLRWTTNASSDTSAIIQAPIILLHGFAQSAESWTEVASHLALNRAVYALDLIGHGKSDCPDEAEPYTLDAQADALCAFMDYVSRETLPQDLGDSATAGQPYVKPVVVGYSMGGRVALAAVMRAPDKFGALVLESAGLGPATEQEREAAAISDAARAETLRADGIEAFMDAWEKLSLFASQAQLPQETQAAIRAGRLANNASALAYTFENAGQHCMPDRTCVLDALRNAEFPMLYICGELDEKYCALAATLNAGEWSGITPDTGVWVAASLHTQIIAGVGHNVHLEDPTQYINVIDAFLEAD